MRKPRRFPWGALLVAILLAGFAANVLTNAGRLALRALSGAPASSSPDDASTGLFFASTLLVQLGWMAAAVVGFLLGRRDALR